MLPTVWRTVLALGVCAVLLAPPAEAQCRGQDSTSTNLIYDVAGYTTATDSLTRAVRDSLRLPSVPASQVVLVADSSVCRKAASAYQSQLAGQGLGGFTGSVYVVQAGTTYTVLDPGYHYTRGDGGVLLTFDSHWKLLSKHL